MLCRYVSCTEDMCFCWSKKEGVWHPGTRRNGKCEKSLDGKERLGGYFADQTLMLMVVYFHHLLAKMIQFDDYLSNTVG